MNKNNYRTFQQSEVEYFMNHPEEIKDYLEIALEEYQRDRNEKAFLVSLSIIAKAKGGIVKLAEETGLNREHLYRALSEKGNPKFSTIIEIMRALGLSLKVA